MQKINLRTSIWWIVSVLGLLGIWVSLQPITAEDFWWHMKIGDVIRNNGAIPQTGIFSATQADAGFVYQSWGSEILFSWLYELGGLSLIHLVRGILTLLTYALVGWNALKRTHNGRAAAIAIFLAASVAFTNWAARPQMFSMPLCALMLLILEQVSRERWSIWTLATIPVLEILWVNLHGAFILGPLIVGAYAVGITIDRRRDHIEAAIYRTMRAMWITTGATLLALLVNPKGVGVIGYVWNLLTDPSSQQLVSEWSSPLSKLGLPISQFFLMTCFVAFIFIATTVRKLRMVDLLLFGGITLLAFTGIRYLLWFGIIVGPIIADAIIRRGRLAITKTSSEATPMAAIFGIALSVVVLLLQAPWRGILPLEALKTNNTPIARADLVEASTPLEAVEYLRSNPPAEALFNDESHGSYIIWRAGEELPVFVDTRIELYPLEQWLDFKCIQQGENWQALLNKYAISTVLVKLPDQAALQTELKNSEAWVAVYSDEYSEVYERQSTANITEEPCSLN